MKSGFRCTWNGFSAPGIAQWSGRARTIVFVAATARNTSGGALAVLIEERGIKVGFI